LTLVVELLHCGGSQRGRSRDNRADRFQIVRSDSRVVQDHHDLKRVVRLGTTGKLLLTDWRYCEQQRRVVRLQQFDKLRTDEIRHHYQVATLSEEVEENTDHAVYVKERQENGNHVLEAT
jgi:hypothetical protein